MSRAPDVSWVTGLLLEGPQPDELAAGIAPSLDLALVPDGAGQDLDPFVVVGDSGRFSRVLLGRIALGGSTVQHLAVKIQKDSYRPAGAGLAASALCNAEIDAMWAREREHLAKVGASEITESLPLGQSGFRVGPLAFCRKTTQFWRPLCPETRTHVDVCRDDEWLADVGLEPYSTSTTRYLCGALDSSGARPRTVYTWTTDGDAGRKVGVTVRHRGELYEDVASLFDRDLPDDVVARLEREFPCWTCDHRTECYAKEGGKVGERVVPLSYYGTQVLVSRALPFHVDEFFDVLGGQGQLERMLGDHEFAISPARRQILGGLQAALTGPSTWLYRLEGGQRLAAEVLLLKLNAFAQTCRAIQVFHATCDRPHLGVSPDNIMVVVPAVGSGLPARWQFAVKLVDVGCQHRLSPSGQHAVGLPELVVPSLDAQRSYQSPLVRDAEFGFELPMKIAIEVADASAPVVVRARTTGSRVVGPRAGDLVRITPHASLPGLGDGNLAGVVQDIEDAGGRFALHLAAEEIEAVSRLTSAFDASVAFYPRFHAPCDLFGLGMLLFRAILTHDQRDAFAVESLVDSMLDQLTLAVRGARDPNEQLIVDTLRGLVNQERAALPSASVLFDAADRAGLEDAIPADIWADVLNLGFRLVTNFDHFSICAHHGDYDPERPGAIVDGVADDVDMLSARLEVELFGREARDREISTLCGELMKQVGRSLVGEVSDTADAPPGQSDAENPVEEGGP